MKIIHNTVQCKRCLEVIESLHVHDYVQCKCGAVAVDGGQEYLKRSGFCYDYKEMSVVKPDVKEPK